MTGPGASLHAGGEWEHGWGLSTWKTVFILYVVISSASKALLIKPVLGEGCGPP